MNATAKPAINAIAYAPRWQNTYAHANISIKTEITDRHGDTRPVYLAIENQFDTDTDREPTYSYAWTFGVTGDQHYSGPVGYEAARDAVAVLGPIDRKLRALVDRFGHPATYGEYVARIFAACGIDTFEVRQYGREPITWHAGEARNLIDGWISRMRREAKPGAYAA